MRRRCGVNDIIKELNHVRASFLLIKLNSACLQHPTPEKWRSKFLKE